MRREKFDEIYDNIIFTLKSEIDTTNITRFRFNACNRIFSEYQAQRDILKKHYMRNPDENIDRHKIAACMMYAIMKVEPVRIPLRCRIENYLHKKMFPVELSYVNEYLAVYTAISILNGFFLQDKAEDRLDKHRHQIYIPSTFSDDYGYIFNMCISLKFAKARNKIDILTYANIFFLMEYQHLFDNEPIQDA